MTDKSFKQEFGTYKPKGLDAIAIKMAQSGLGRGKLKKSLYNFWQKRNPHYPVDISYHGLKLRLEPQHNTIENKILFSAKQREAVELDHLKKLLTNGGTFLDIGANFGYYSLMAAQMGADKVISIEPNPALHQRLSDIADLNQFNKIIDANCLGLGESESTLELTLNPVDLGSSSMADPDMVGEKIQVQILPLLKLLKDKNITAIDAMKIDVEGMEDRVLFPFFENAPKTLHPKLIIMEENASLWNRNILKWLLENGYNTKHKSRGNFILEIQS